jgi:hypothetical protein
MEIESMFDIPEEERTKLAAVIDEMIADMDTRSDEFMKALDAQRDRLNALSDQLTPAEMERRDLANGISQMSVEFALVPHQFLKANRDALLRNGPDLVYLIVNMVMNSQAAVGAAVDEYQRDIQDALNSDDTP